MTMPIRGIAVAAAMLLLMQDRAAAQMLPPAAPTQPAVSDGPFSCPPSTAQPRPFTPFMLGDITGPLASLFLDIKIAEGNSPRPMDRVYYDFNAFSNVNKSQWVDPTQPVQRLNLYRNVFGFEKTFFDGQVSLGLRLPFYTLDIQTKGIYLQPTTQGFVPTPGGPGSDATHFGNISMTAKALLWEDRETGSLLSGGMVLTVPTASSTLIDPGQSLLAYAQPFGGFILNRDDFYVQGFVSMILPIARPESTVLFIDAGAGYWVYRGDNRSQMLTGIAPTVEIHITDPLRQANPTIPVFGIFDNVRVHNVVDVTVGATFELYSRATVGLGVVVPVTGPKPFDIEGMAHFNWRF